MGHDSEDCEGRDMMNKLLETFDFIRTDDALTRKLYMVTLVMAILVVVVLLKDSMDKKTYILDNNGNIVGFERQSLDTSETFNFKLLIDDGRKQESRDVTINKSPVSSKQSKETDSRDTDYNAELAGAISDVELSTAKVIRLPVKLSDGTRLKWTAVDQGGSSLSIMIAIYIALVTTIIYDRLRKPVTDGEIIRKKVLKGLPRFSNQLLLMLNSGMILNDALETIAASYRIIPEGKRDFFAQEYLRIIDKYQGHRISPASKINELAANTRVKELIRIASILYENERRGFDITDNLSRESGFLWEDRKIVAKERGKMIDTRMSYPLGILLLLLIVITMAPAMLTM